MGKVANMGIRDNTGMTNGEVAHQGDVYIVRVATHNDVYDIHEDLWPRTKKRGNATLNRQLVAGNTKGSRHVVEGEKVQVYTSPEGSSALEGPTIVAEGEWTLTHPEHAHHKFGAGTYVAIFQRDFTQRRVTAVTD